MLEVLDGARPVLLRMMWAVEDVCCPQEVPQVLWQILGSMMQRRIIIWAAAIVNPNETLIPSLLLKAALGSKGIICMP
jgi:hypothetical protein